MTNEYSELSTIINSIPTGICVFHHKDGISVPIALNATFCMFSGKTIEERLEELKTDCYAGIHPDDKKLLQEKMHSMKNEECLAFEYRYWSAVLNKYIWIKYRCIAVDDGEGGRFFYATYNDIDERKTAELALSKKQIELEALVSSVPGGIFKYSADKDEQFTYISKNMLEMLGYTDEEFRKKFDNRFSKMVYSADRERVLKEISDYGTKGNFDYCEYRIETKSGALKWVYDIGNLITDENGKKWYYVVVVDIDERKTIESALSESEAGYKLAVKSANLSVWNYDIQNHRILSMNNNIDDSEIVAENVPWSIIDSGNVCEESKEDYIKLYERVCEGEPIVSAEIWGYHPGNNETKHCKRITYSVSCDENGVPVVAHGVSREITNEKLAFASYQKLMHEMSMMNPGALGAISLNLTDNICVPIGGVSDYMKRIPATVDFLFDDLAMFIPSVEERIEFSKEFTREKLIQMYLDGETQLSVIVECNFIGGKHGWVECVARLIQNPITGKIEAIMYARDATEQKIEEDILKNVAGSSNFDYIALIDVKQRKIEFRSISKSAEKLVSGTSEYYDDDYIRAIKKSALPEEWDDKIREASLDTITEKLLSAPFYIVPSTRRDKEGNIYFKQTKYSYLNERRDFILMTMTDVTDIHNKEQLRVTQLQQALDYAEKATEAKSIFLSNISHDMRTPLNGVIGFTELAVEAKTIEEKDEFLKKINESGQFLLNLINDTLELSKVESKKVTLVYEPVSAPELIKSIISTVKPTADEKKITISLDNDECGLQYIKTDKLRFQQIFLNILTNAVKFTHENGRVDFICKEVNEAENDGCNSCITIKDNGIGMSPEFVEKAFEPFTQDTTNAELKNRGTGLGLSIVKQLVELMGGYIELESKVNVGSTFKIYLPLEKVDNFQPKQVNIEDGILHLKGKRVLLCEDHPINTELAVRLLEKEGIVVTCTVDGQEGVDTFAKSETGYFDAVLMDIRMPVMNGLDATRAIRALDRDDAKTIPIIAMTANAFDDDVKKSADAGMNAHLTKPIKPGLLYGTLNKLIK